MDPPSDPGSDARGDAGVRRIEERSTDEERLEVEATLLVQSDNRARPEDEPAAGDTPPSDRPGSEAPR